MKKISITKVKKELAQLNADPATSELIINNAQLYNDLIDKYDSGDTKNLYLSYQLNVQITKQIESVRKFSLKINGTDEDDQFTELVSSLKNKTEVR
jgi:hypothetical protein